MFSVVSLQRLTPWPHLLALRLQGFNETELTASRISQRAPPLAGKEPTVSQKRSATPSHPSLWGNFQNLPFPNEMG